MKKLTELRKEKPYYFVSVDGKILFESEKVGECKDFLCDYIKNNKGTIDVYETYIGMYNIDIIGEDD